MHNYMCVSEAVCSHANTIDTIMIIGKDINVIDKHMNINISKVSLKNKLTIMLKNESVVAIAKSFKEILPSATFRCTADCQHCMRAFQDSRIHRVARRLE